jgi:hypothetical protein
MIVPRENFEQRGSALAHREPYCAAARYSGGVNFPAPIEPVLRGHFV